MHNQTFDLTNWQPLSVADTAELFAAFPAPWWIGGGWAIDLFIGRQTRVHEDTDVEVLRRNQLAVLRLLAGWECFEADSGQLYPWRPGIPLRAHVNSIWCRHAPDAPWSLQVTFAPADGDAWIYRREPSITRPIAEIGRVTPGGIPYLCPELQLLFKSKSPRPKDELDFSQVLPLLDTEQRAWLLAALTHAGHAEHWQARLRGD